MDKEFELYFELDYAIVKDNKSKIMSTFNKN